MRETKSDIRRVELPRRDRLRAGNKHARVVEKGGGGSAFSQWSGLTPPYMLYYSRRVPGSRLTKSLVGW